MQVHFIKYEVKKKDNIQTNSHLYLHTPQFIPLSPMLVMGNFFRKDRSKRQGGGDPQYL